MYRDLIYDLRIIRIESILQLKPSDETLKQGRNRDNGVLSDSPSPSFTMKILINVFKNLKKFLK